MKTSKVLALALLVSACSESQLSQATQQIPRDSFVTATISDQESPVDVQGAVSISQQSDGNASVELWFQPTGRGSRRTDAVGQSIVLGLDMSRATSLFLGRATSFSEEINPSSRVVYYARPGVNVTRAVTSATLTRGPHQTFSIVLELGIPREFRTSFASSGGGRIEDVASNSRAEVRGQLVVGCAVRGGMTAIAHSDGGATETVLGSVADPTFQTPFCRDALTRLGLTDRLLAP